MYTVFFHIHPGMNLRVSDSYSGAIDVHFSCVCVGGGGGGGV